MGTRQDIQADSSIRQKQLHTLHRNLNTLLERQAKYAGNAPLDLLNQIEDHRQAIDLIEQALNGHLTEQELEQALRPLLLAVRNGQIINVSAALPGWLRMTTVSLLGVAALTLFGVGFLIFQDHPTGQPSVFPTPDPARLEIIASPGPEWAITALAIEATEEGSTLWIGSEAGSHYTLYRLDTAGQAKAKPVHALDVEQRVIDLTVDCRGNVWVLLNEAGTKVYRPQTDQAETLLNISTTHHWLTKNTTEAIATRCREDGTVEVWLGREGIHTLRYQADYPTLTNITFVPPATDPAFQASQELTAIQALVYVPQEPVLWAADRNGGLLFLPLKGVRQPKIDRFEQSLWAVTPTGGGSGVWLGASHHLIQAAGENQIIPLAQADGTLLDMRATTVAVGAPWVWFGDSCPDTSATCWPLGIYNSGRIEPVETGRHRSVTAIVIDPQGGVWIGTAQGLLFYPGQAG